MFGRKLENGNIAILEDEDGSPVTRIDANIYPVNSDKSARYEHPEGIILTAEDAENLNIEIE